MSRDLNFYFGTAIFFIGVLMMATGIANLVVQRLDFIVLVALVSGILLLIIGYVVGKGNDRSRGKFLFVFYPLTLLTVYPIIILFH